MTAGLDRPIPTPDRLHLAHKKSEIGRRLSMMGIVEQAGQGNRGLLYTAARMWAVKWVKGDRETGSRLQARAQDLANVLSQSRVLADARGSRRRCRR